MPLGASSGVDDSGRTFNSNSYFGRSAILVGCRPAHISDKPSIRTPTERSETRYGLTCPVMFNILQFELLGVKRFVIVPLKIDAETSIQTPTKAGVKQWMRNRLHPHRSSFNSNSCSTGVKRSVRLWVRRGIGFLQCKPLLYRSETRGGMLPAALRPNPSMQTPALTGSETRRLLAMRSVRYHPSMQTPAQE